MTELLYFSSCDLMVKVDFQSEANALRYSSHRVLRPEEKLVVEQYILSELAPQTGYLEKQPTMFVYLGRDRKLEKRLAVFHLRNNMKKLLEKEEEVTRTVSHLINHSMQDYYSEKIGELLLSVRQQTENGTLIGADQTAWCEAMQHLVSAYNAYAEQKVTVDKIVPADLRGCFKEAARSGY